jgi:ribosomal protein S18 acetylase RimI-like enzyme
MEDRPITIRAATAEDTPELVRLYVAYRLFYGELAAGGAALEFVRERIQRGAGEYFLAWDCPSFAITGTSSSPVAFMHLMPSTNTLAMRPIWILEDLYVEPAARNRGMATSLLRHAEAFARATGAERITLSTAHDNQAAQSIYKKLGYIREEHFWYFHRLLS